MMSVAVQTGSSVRAIAERAHEAVKAAPDRTLVQTLVDIATQALQASDENRTHLRAALDALAVARAEIRRQRAQIAALSQ